MGSFAVGQSVDRVVLQLTKDAGVSRPRIFPVSHFPKAMRVEFPRKLREQFPLGTKFQARVKVCQKHNKDGTPRGAVYLSASKIGVIIKSIADRGLVAKLDPSGADGRKYFYIREEA